jgi:hypothetical protein
LKANRNTKEERCLLIINNKRDYSTIIFLEALAKLLKKLIANKLMNNKMISKMITKKMVTKKTANNKIITKNR